MSCVPHRKENETYEEASKRYALNQTVKHLYPNLRKLISEAKQARLNNNLDQELSIMQGIEWAVSKQISSIKYKIEQNKLHSVKSV